MGARPGSRVGTAKEIGGSRTGFSGTREATGCYTGDDTMNRVHKAGQRRLSDDAVKLYSARRQTLRGGRFGEVRLRTTRKGVRASKP